jgi:putative ABC transport system permease protein
MIGVGADVLRAFGVVLVLVAGLSVFIALLNALEDRRYDLAVMRMLGASRAKLMGLMLLEGAVLSALGGIAGIALGHLCAEGLGWALKAAQQTAVTGWACPRRGCWRLPCVVAAALLPLAPIAQDVAPFWQRDDNGRDETHPVAILVWRRYRWRRRPCRRRTSSPDCWRRSNW